jgi:hypothetical protein
MSRQETLEENSMGKQLHDCTTVGSGMINKIESIKVLSGNQCDGYNKKQETSNDRKSINRKGIPKGKTTDRKCSLQTKELNIQTTGKIIRKRLGVNNLKPTRARKLVSLYNSLNGETQDKVQAHLGLQHAMGI